ncbi:MAG: NFACT family protein [Gracilibacteraceae bacterium]|jgi:predicted ribosome quality control (RQC) complex YloA/Tae2 family protein|nr:NFACT family protein [Gracilibacteraceae bacterium]
MALDSVTLRSLLAELRPLLLGLRVDKATQAEKDEVCLHLRGPGLSRRLLLNASAAAARLHLTERVKKSPAAAPMFCMVLRKYLEGARITDLSQGGAGGRNWERVAVLTAENYNERGDRQPYLLYLEIMGKHSNLILVDAISGLILDGLRRYSRQVSRYREVLPGRPYIFPPAQDKANVSLDESPEAETFARRLLAGGTECLARDALLREFAGVSPELAREICLRAGLDADAAVDALGLVDYRRLRQEYGCFFAPEPPATDARVYYEAAESGPPLAFSFIPYLQYGRWRGVRQPSLNAALETYYYGREQFHHMEATRGSLRKVTRDQMERLLKKSHIYEKSLAQAEKDLVSRRRGELLTAYIYALQPGAKEAVLADYNEPGAPEVVVALDPRLNAVQNAQRYFRQYAKARSVLSTNRPLLAAAQAEVEYLRTLRLSVDQAATPEELGEVYLELAEQGFIAGKQNERKQEAGKQGKGAGKRGRGGRSPKTAPPASRPHVYLSATGHTIIVGRNNRQNDRMTWKQAQSRDMWLHVKDIPGSHVIIPLAEGQEFPDDRTLLDGAALAVYFSQARGSSHVPVDYTHVRQIKKPGGARPGMVVYEQNWSLFITPAEEDIKRLLAAET